MEEHQAQLADREVSLFMKIVHNYDLPCRLVFLQLMTIHFISLSYKLYMYIQVDAE